MPCEPLKHTSFDLTQVAFSDGQEAENELSVMRPLDTSLSRLHQSRILTWSIGRKWVPSPWRPLQTSLSQTHQNRISGFSRGRKWLLNAICHVNRRFINLRKVAFSVGQKWLQSDIWQFESSLFLLNQIAFSAIPDVENKLRMPFETLKHRFSNSPKSHFGMVKKSKMSSKCFATPWNIAFSTSPILQFRLVKRKKTSTECLATT